MAQRECNSVRIVQINKYYFPHVGGIEHNVRLMSEGLVAAGHQVRAIVSNSERRYSEEILGGVEIVRLPRLFERASTPVTSQFGKVLAYEAQGADIMHFHFPYPWAEFEWVFQLVSKSTPYVVTYHSDIVRQKQAFALYRPCLEKFLKRAQLITVESPQMIEHSPHLSPFSHKCRVVHPGLPVEDIAHNKAAVKRAVQLRKQYAPDGKPIVLFVGRLVYYKGIEVLAQAIPKVDAHFVIIGKGPGRGVFDSASQQNVHFIDYADNDELIAWFHAADVLTLPSTEVSEAFGLVQIEAHAAGTPVVSSRLRSGVPYANLDGVTGLTFPPRNAAALAGSLNALLADDDLRLRLGKQAQQRALAEFTIDQMVTGVSDVYREALS